MQDIIRSGFNVSRLKAGSVLLIESTLGTLYALNIIEDRLVDVQGTDPLFRTPKRGIFVESWSAKVGGTTFPDWIGKDLRMMLRFADANFLTEPVATALIEGDGWKYEAIQ